METHNSGAAETHLIPHRLKTVRIGIQATILALVALAIYAVLPGQEAISTGRYWLVLLAAALGALVVSLLPWRVLFERGVGMWFMYAWSGLDIVLITLLIAVSGGSGSELFGLYVLTTVFFAASYPARGQAFLLGFTFSCYLIVLAATEPQIKPGILLLRLSVLAICAFIGGFISSQLMRSMTENMRRFEDERQNVRRLEELDQLKSDFISTVSHELRTPLTVVVGAGLTLERRWESIEPAKRLEMMRVLNSNAEHLDSVISTLLDFSRLEAGRMEVRTERISLAEVLDEAVGKASSMLDMHDFVTDYRGRLGVDADPILIERVVESLLSNAAKYTPDGTRIVLSAVEIDGEVEVAITDDGPGIPTDELDHVRERFFRGGHPDRRDTRGVGLGLSLAVEILRLHRSHLQIESEQGRGSRFSFKLPACTMSPRLKLVEPDEAEAAAAEAG